MLLLLLAALAPPPAAPAAPPLQTRAAFFYTGQVLRRTCSQDDDISLGLCVGYIDSALDALLFRDTYANPRHVCLSDKVTNAVLRASVIQTLAADRDGLRLPAFTYVEKAVAKGWPCAPAPQK